MSLLINKLNTDSAPKKGYEYIFSTFVATNAL